MGLAGGPAGLGRDFGFAMCKMEPWKTLFSVPFLSFFFPAFSSPAQQFSGPKSPPN